MSERPLLQGSVKTMLDVRKSSLVYISSDGVTKNRRDIEGTSLLLARIMLVIAARMATAEHGFPKRKLVYENA